ncbi:MAG: glucan 1,4-alpha-glucosidase [Nitrospirae bacterium]|nr:glucan 1,4-alpha-glucosidase [Magnetococcales bacterium]HAT49894.1 glucan 1,4-alpha-glucosidase [Alphaproteobacteria bacterium]
MRLFILLASVTFLGLGLPQFGVAASGGAPGAQGGLPTTWAPANKTGVGTAYEQTKDGKYQDSGPTGVISKVWFSIAQGIVTETSWGLIHEAQIKDLQLLMVGSDGVMEEERKDTQSTVDYLHKDSSGRPLSLAYKVVNTSKNKKYIIEKHVFTDPDRQSLFVRMIITAHEDGMTPYLLVNPHMNNTGVKDEAYVSNGYLNAHEGSDRYMSLQVRGGSGQGSAFEQVSAGFVGESDGWTDLHADGKMDFSYEYAAHGRGSVAMTGKLRTLKKGETQTFDLAVGFGVSHDDAVGQATATLNQGYTDVLKRFHGEGAHIGWSDYVAKLGGLSSMWGATGDGGALLQTSAMVLKAHEDKTHAGAVVASLAIPWGDTVTAESYQTGYRAVWVRDFYQVATAFLALGDKETALTAFRYLNKVQVRHDTPNKHADGAVGWFLQKTHVDGQQEWIRVQMDQVAMPIMLAWNLWKSGAMGDAELREWYHNMLKPAAEFLANGGRVHLGDNDITISPPYSQQERWEEQPGYSPSTVAAVITGLVVAADIANSVAYDPGAADWYYKKADAFEAQLENTMVTHTGEYGNKIYYLRVTQDTNPEDGDLIVAKNGQQALSEKKVLDPGFLELVRYGIRHPKDPAILNSIIAVDGKRDDAASQIYYTFGPEKFPGWRRYAQGDGYGERLDNGANFMGDDGQNRGRVWPIFTGERGHYELELAKAKAGNQLSAGDAARIRDTYVKAMEKFANEGYMLPEQVWDNVGDNATHHYEAGEGTNSATPLAWSHAEYVKLVRSLADGNTFNSYPIVRERYWKAPTFQSTYAELYLRGTFNQWGATAMKLVSDHTWDITVHFDGAAASGFKFDIDGEDWHYNLGDNDVDGIADRDGHNIPVTQGPGEYRITLNDGTKAYTIKKIN